jgi:hypothetical protein
VTQDADDVLQQAIDRLNFEALRQDEFWPKTEPSYRTGRKDGLQRAVGILFELLEHSDGTGAAK